MKITFKKQKEQIIQRTAEHVQSLMIEFQESGDFDPGHDWSHIQRVWNNARSIAIEESKIQEINFFIVELSALLHDLDDWKFSDELEQNRVNNWLDFLNLDSESKEHILNIINNLSFKGAGVSSNIKTIEGKIVQDADRLDAIGAVGIARAFSYGGFKKRSMFNQEIKPMLHNSFDEYKNNKGTTINHFYEKLLLLKDKMNTETAKKIAESRHRFMLEFLDQFHKEQQL